MLYIYTYICCLNVYVYIYIFMSTYYILHLRSAIDFMLSQAECWLDYEVPEWADKENDSLRR